MAVDELGDIDGEQGHKIRYSPDSLWSPLVDNVRRPSDEVHAILKHFVACREG